MLDQGFTRGRPSGHHVHHSRWQGPASWASDASRSVETGDTSDGLITTVLPAASAGASFQNQQGQRAVPRRQSSNHADRFAHCEMEHRGHAHRDRLSGDRLRDSREEPQMRGSPRV